MTHTVWSLYIDGSDIGLARSDINAFQMLEDGHILISIDKPRNLPGLGRVDDSDIIKFIPTQTGNNTKGHFEWYFDGSDVRLTTNGEDIDALALLDDGSIMISTLGNARVPGVRGAVRNKDMLRFIPTQLGRRTRGKWQKYFEGIDVQLSGKGEQIRGTWIRGNQIYLTTHGNFALDGLQGTGSDIFVCHAGSTGTDTTCTFSPFWQGQDFGFGTEIIDAFSIQPIEAIYNAAQVFDNEITTADVLATESVDSNISEIGTSELRYLYLPIINR